MTLQFECGCFMQPFINDENMLQMGVACCPEHQVSGSCVLHGQVLKGIEDITISAPDETNYIGKNHTIN